MSPAIYPRVELYPLPAPFLSNESVATDPDIPAYSWAYINITPPAGELWLVTYVYVRTTGDATSQVKITLVDTITGDEVELKTATGTYAKCIFKEAADGRLILDSNVFLRLYVYNGLGNAEEAHFIVIAGKIRELG